MNIRKVLKCALFSAIVGASFSAIEVQARTTVIKQTVCAKNYHRTTCASSVRVVRTRHVYRHRYYRYRYYRHYHRCHRCYR